MLFFCLAPREYIVSKSREEESYAIERRASGRKIINPHREFQVGESAVPGMNLSFLKYSVVVLIGQPSDSAIQTVL